MTDTITKGLIGKEDLSLFDGIESTFTRKTSTGGTQTLARIDWPGADVEQIYNSRTSAALNDAISAIGDNTALIYLSAGDWVIDDNVTVPNNIHVSIQPGAYFSQSDGDETITFYSPGHIIASERQTLTSADMIRFTTPGTVYATWFQADPYTNGYEAILYAMEAAVSPSSAMDNCHVHIPGGDYTIDTTGAFSGVSVTEQQGIKVTGDGWGATRLILNPSGSDLWFYNNVTTQTMQFAVFSDIAFLGTDTDVDSLTYAGTSTYANGFRTYSTGHEQGFKFNNCLFRSLDIAFQLRGTDTASEMLFNGCKISHIKSIVYDLDNLSSLNHTFLGTDVEVIWGHVFNIGTTGGGAIKVYGGSWIMEDDAGSDKYFINGPDGTGTSSNTAPYVFDGLKFELRGNTTKLVNLPEATGGMNAAFNDCSFWSTATAVKTNWVIIGEYKDVIFNRCVWAWDNSAYYEVYDLEGSSQLGQPGHIEWVDCHVHDDLSEHINFNNDYGWASARRCQYDTIGSISSSPYVLANDFDLFGNAGVSTTLMMAGQSDSSVRLKTVSFLHDSYHPYNNTNEKAVKLPKNALIKAIRIYKPASGSSSAAWCAHVSNDDKSTIYVSSTKDEHQYAFKVNYERGSKVVAELTTRTDNDTGVYTVYGENNAISDGDTVNVRFVSGRRVGMTVSAIDVDTTAGVVTISVDGGDGDNLPAANTVCVLESVSGFIECGGTDNERIVRYWSSDGDGSTAGGGSVQTGGYAIVEYY